MSPTLAQPVNELGMERFVEEPNEECPSMGSNEDQLDRMVIDQEPDNEAEMGSNDAQFHPLFDPAFNDPVFDDPVFDEQLFDEHQGNETEMGSNEAQFDPRFDQEYELEMENEADEDPSLFGLAFDVDEAVNTVDKGKNKEIIQGDEDPSLLDFNQAVNTVDKGKNKEIIHVDEDPSLLDFNQAVNTVDKGKDKEITQEGENSVGIVKTEEIRWEDDNPFAYGGMAVAGPSWLGFRRARVAVGPVVPEERQRWASRDYWYVLTPDADDIKEGITVAPGTIVPEWWASESTVLRGLTREFLVLYPGLPFDWTRIEAAFNKCAMRPGGRGLRRSIMELRQEWKAYYPEAAALHEAGRYDEICLLDFFKR
ncbi:hypothetical protein FN846DRAFT_338899 [Sphaerosporella brunnea]|uniref:Uncharacterized protein n=1 Tax=Sphaerosporella brunnea TaxID=1250544 RepID=A0A5J5EJR4_9PEZI|nr:hypothetical protein FN846DRAFT_338899 [Sphaerosporella brunnea]